MNARAQLEKIQTYFIIDSMIEEASICFATLQLDDITYEWQQHDMITQDHGAINSFDIFNLIMMDQFDRKDEDDYFKDLTMVR